ncbi:MAG TPA: hypothetical protein VGO47_04675, partial [Chlamydiales bacterium]|nr:hypothetical protein [Chlamydiales bacterium]
MPPNFVDGVWTIARVRVPTDEINNGTMFPLTESYRSTANCQLAENVRLFLFLPFFECYADPVG